MTSYSMHFRLVLHPSPKIGFQVKTSSRVLQERPVNPIQFPWKCIRKMLTQPSVAFFVWVMALGNI